MSFEYLYMDEPRNMVFANNKGADQPEHQGSLISAFVIRLLKRQHI